MFIISKCIQSSFAYLLLPTIRTAVNILSSHQTEAGQNHNWVNHCAHCKETVKTGTFIVFLSGLHVHFCVFTPKYKVYYIVYYKVYYKVYYIAS